MQTSKVEFEKFQERSVEFINYLFDNYGSLFVCQKTFCLSEFLDNAPQSIRTYFENVAGILSTIPLRFSILKDSLHDNQFADLERHEFIYNKNDFMFKFISQTLRNQSNFDHLGIEKHDWIIEVIQKFNLISILNYIFREALSMLRNQSLD